MSNWTKAAIAFVGGVTLGIGLLRLKPADPAEPSTTALGAIPPQRESLVVLTYLLETRADARDVRFMVWWPPVAVATNPYTHEPATRVQLILQPGGTTEVYESWLAYLKGDQVLGVEPVVEGDRPARVSLPEPVASPRPEALTGPVARRPLAVAVAVE